MSMAAEKYGQNDSFFERQIKRITKEDPKERFRLKEQKNAEKLAAKGLVREENSSPGLRPSKSHVLDKKRLVLSKQKLKKVTTQNNTVETSLRSNPNTMMVEYMDEDLDTFKHTHIASN